MTSWKRIGKRNLDMRIGSWNVLSLYTAKALHLLLEQMEQYNIDLIAIQEVKWIGNGTLNKKNHTVLYSCHPKKHIEGTGFIVSKRIRHLILEFEEKTEEEKDIFYENLDKIYYSCPKYDVKIILGDLNTKVGREREFKFVTGGSILHDATNDSGHKLIDFATLHNMIIGRTSFPHKNIHKDTWRAPCGTYANQIDHVVIDARHCSDSMDFKGETLRDNDCDKLKNERIRLEYCEKVKEQLNLKNYDGTVKNKWKCIKDSICNAANTAIGKVTKKQVKYWYDIDCAIANDKNNVAYRHMIQAHRRNRAEEYHRRRKEVKKLFRQNKRVFDEELLIDVGHLKSINECRAFYRKINSSPLDFKQTSSLCRNKFGEIISDNQDILKRWHEHF
ncbi:craniofacial development protein 2-like [Parasteatoda tepidariorum]|uniref:craniofacial development protein 2-like n=1 Tax=Parasteatoda tepidariorum TaxID=114398 RepID=UPI0039BC28BB